MRGMKSLESQTFKDFEVLAYHDGPPLSSTLLEESPFKVRCTKKRYDDWGHSLRDKGIKKAKGKYIIHFNPDNILYPDALKSLSKCKEDILIFEILMRGMEEILVYDKLYRFYSSPRDLSKTVRLKGNPASFGNIDCLQLVMKTSLWKKEGGWKDKSEQGDGIMYPAFVKKYETKYIAKLLGEHF